MVGVARFVMSSATAVLLVVGLVPAASSASPSEETLGESTAKLDGPRTRYNYKAGYASSPRASAIRTAQAEYTIPALECDEKRYSVGIGLGYEPSRGDPVYLAHTWLRCYRGEALYQLSAHLNGESDSAAAEAGDRVRVSIKRANSGVLTVLTENLTTGDFAIRTAVPDAGSPTDPVEFGAFPLFVHNRVLGVPDFGRITLEYPTIQDASGSACLSETDPERYKRATRNEVKITPQNLQDCSFDLRFDRH